MTGDERRFGDRWERILGKYGLATVIALGLTAWLASNVSGQVSKVRETLDLHVSETNFYLRQVCINTAQNEGQRAGCIPPRESGR